MKNTVPTVVEELKQLIANQSVVIALGTQKAQQGSIGYIHIYQYNS